MAERLRALAPNQLILCAPVIAELTFGAYLSSRREQNLERVDRLTAGMNVAPFDERAARRFGEIKSKLRRRGIAKTDFDLAIAVIALEQGAVLVTNDRALQDGSIEGLDFEDCLSGSG